jgi:Na+-translocating ferredoxin:NAD+ oxidoreductase subunit B
MLSTVLICAGCMTLLGTAFGLGLAAAARRFHVESDPRVDAVYEALPHIDCGACGLPGCSAFAAAVVKGAAKVDGCVPGGLVTAQAVAAVLGVELNSTRQAWRAVMHCQGGRAEARTSFEYVGVPDCRSAKLVQGGPKVCKAGCLGFGTCAATCPFGAITMSPNGLPVISEKKCTGCGLCVKVCPVGILSLLPTEQRVFLGCSNRAAKGRAMKDMCSRGCIKCRLCVKVAPWGLIQWEHELPKIDYAKGDDFDHAVEDCPMGTFVDEREVPARSYAHGSAGWGGVAVPRE